MSLLKKPLVLAVGLAVAAAAVYWFWPGAEPAAVEGQAAAGKPAAGQRPAGQRPGGPDQPVPPIIPGLCLCLCG